MHVFIVLIKNSIQTTSCFAGTMSVLSTQLLHCKFKLGTNRTVAAASSAFTWKSQKKKIVSYKSPFLSRLLTILQLQAYASSVEKHLLLMPAYIVMKTLTQVQLQVIRRSLGFTANPVVITPHDDN
jgi:hypothetical protein